MSIQTRLPDEIVIVDAGSKDGTWELMKDEASRTDRPWKMKAIQEIRCNVARGRNLAIEASEGDLIVSTDIGCDWDPEWLEELAAPLLKDPQIEQVNGSWAVEKKNLRGPWAITEWALKGDQRLEAQADSHCSSRSIAYRKSSWGALGGYSEDLTLAGDDAVYDYMSLSAGVKRVGIPTIRCYWHRHESLNGFYKEAYRYGLGDAEAGIRGRDMLLIGGRMALEIVLIVSGLLALLSGIPLSPWAGIIFVSIALASVAARILRMKPAISRLREERISYPPLRLLAFTYGTKWHWLRGYFKGMKRGRTHCMECRRGLKEMSPSLYRNNLESQDR